MEQWNTSLEKITQARKVIVAISHPMRYAILQILAGTDARTKDLSIIFSKQSGEVSKHLMVLKGAGLIVSMAENQKGRRKAEGKNRVQIYSLHPRIDDALIEAINRIAG